VERLLDRGQGDVHDRDVEQEHEGRHANRDERPPLSGHERNLHWGLMEQTLDVSNAVAAELAGISDGVLDALKERLACTVRLRGNQLTLQGEEQQVADARAVIDELVELVEGGHQIGSHTVDAVLGTLEAGQDVREVFDAVVWRHRGKKIAPKTVTQKKYVDAIRRSTVTFGIGPAGTGKTYLAMALAVAALHERQVARIILTRPAVEAGERLGFLPGDLMAKVDPYLRPLFDALYDMLDPDRANGYMERGTIEVAPLAYMRGRTINDSFIILDEAQNTSPEQMQMFLTRLGFGSKIVVTGDITQIDLPGGTVSGLKVVREILDGVDDVHFSALGSEDVVRHKLVSRIVDAYAQYDAELTSGPVRAPGRRDDRKRGPR
jgi:phosphate starvation-inducible PhoH-like protein